jgi:ribosome-associated protein
MDIRKLQRAIVDGLEDVKGQNIVVFNTEHLSPLFERVIIATGTSNRQTKALAASVRDAVKALGAGVLRTEGEGNGEWIIVDCGTAVVHLMQPNIREYYHLEEIWGDKPVKMKLDTAPKRLVKAESEDDEDDAAPAKKSAARKTAGAKSAGAKTVAKTAAGRAATAKPVAATPAAAKRAAPAGRKSSTTPAAAPVAARKAPAAKKPASKTNVIKVEVNKPKATRKPAASPLATRSTPAKAPAKAPARKAAISITRTTGVMRTTGVKSTATTARPAAKTAVKSPARPAAKKASRKA